jgi:hypothetical protein
MATSTTNLHFEKEREKEATWYADMGFILPLLSRHIRKIHW